MTKPIPREPATCPECGASFVPTRHSRFCSKPHQRAYRNRANSRGKVVLPLLMAAEEGKGGGHTKPHPVSAKCRSEISKIVRDWRDEDRAAGRPPATVYAETLMGSGTLWMDRRRK